MLNEEVFPQLVEMFGDQFENGTFQRLWWAQDGAPGRIFALDEQFHTS